MPMPRQATNGSPPAGEGATGPRGIALGGLLGLAHRALKALDQIALQTGEKTDIAWGGSDLPDKLGNWPIPGRNRVVVPNRSKGQVLVVAPAVYQIVFNHNKGRGGFQLINIGTNPAFVYLALPGDAQGNPGVATGYLFPGGTWDGEITNELWCGPVSVYSALGTTLTVAEI
jgi:hypothetical protein